MMTKTNTDCRIEDLCQYDSLTRTKFFHGMLLTDDLLRGEQTYHREALKRVNRHLWGSGIVCGLEVKKTSGLCINVHPGLALDCHGNVIEVCKCITIDLLEECRKKYPELCVREGGDNTAKQMTKYLVLRSVEIPADPEPVLTSADDCTPPGEETKCQHSKYREGFCLEFRDKCPDCAPCPDEEKEGGAEGLLPILFRLARQPERENVTEELMRDRPDCIESPPCPDSHCDDGAVGLAKLVINCAANTVEVQCECRQYVWSPRLLRWLLCGLFAKIDKLETGLSKRIPSASALLRSPIQTAWDVGAIALSARGRQRFQQDVQNKARQTKIDELEKQMRRVDELEKQVRRFDELEKQARRVDELEKQVRRFDELEKQARRVDELEKQASRVDELEKQVKGLLKPQPSKSKPKEP